MYIYISILKIILHLGSCIFFLNPHVSPNRPTNPNYYVIPLREQIFPNQQESTKCYEMKLTGKNPLQSDFFQTIWMFPKIVVPPKSSILIGFSIIVHPFWGTPIFGNTHIKPIFFQQSPNPIQPDVVFLRNSQGTKMVS